ncbi:ABC transporter ATP-binding protein [Haloarchaeobius sp. HRN-SO-5]|uniref:ABC transporter ATP-binding protein n=1 Tax=Haloarchaeobius sp. HRN-SO-5 TaxID=3446118 RepID=UPI003EBB90F3
MILELDDVNSYYGDSHILRDLSMQVSDGEICALLGRNGAGKTTTLRSIAGAVPPNVRSGTVTFDGQVVTGERPEDVAARGISLVPEERRIFTELTVEENLKLPEVARNASNRWGRSVASERRGLTRADVFEYFPRLEERQEQLAGTLSGGEQQMLAIGRALRQPTDLLLLDEPYEGLAPQIIEAVEDAVRRIRDDGTTILLVEQNAIAAMNISDRCYVIDQGEVVFEGPADALKSDTETRQRYLGV